MDPDKLPVPGTEALVRSPRLARVPGVVHGFSRAMDDRGRRLDLGTHAKPADWSWAASAVGLPGAAVARLRQVHGAVCRTVVKGGVAGDGDALVTHTRGVLLAVRTADCVPVLIAGNGVVVAIHAGWRGLVANVIAQTLAGLSDAGPWVAAVGPCIGAARYEVSEDVVEALAGTGVNRDRFVVRPKAGRPHADLREVARAQLRDAGVADIEVLPHCTWDTPGFWSHRRDGAARGSLAALIGMRED